jgi:3'-5' exonuclease
MYLMASCVIVWDIETVPDLKGFAAANGHSGRGDDEARAAIGDKFPKHIYHSIICIGALVALGRWSLGRDRARRSACGGAPREGAHLFIRGPNRRTVAAADHVQRIVL